MTTYKYPRKRKFSLPREDAVFRLPVFKNDDEVLTGMVQGKDASDLEERAAKAKERAGIQFTYQIEVPLVGDPELKLVDFLDHPNQPVEVYGPISHSSESDRARDFVREQKLNAEFRKLGWKDLQILWWYELENQRQADEIVRQRFT